MSDIITGGTAVAGVVIGLVALIHSILRTRVRGPQFVIPEALVERKHFIDDQGRERCVIKVLIQNIGDRMSSLRADATLHFSLPNKGYSQSAPIPYELDYQAETQQRKSFHFYLPEGSKDWSEGDFIMEGVHSSHKGKMQPFHSVTPVDLSKVEREQKLSAPD